MDALYMALLLLLLALSIHPLVAETNSSTLPNSTNVETLQTQSTLGEEYLIGKLLTQYGDGDSLSLSQLQTLIDSLTAANTESEDTTDHADTGHTDTDDGDTTAACQNSSYWKTDSTCLESKCFTAQDVLDLRDVKTDSINSTILSVLAPTLMYLADHQPANCANVSGEIETSSGTAAEVWGYGFLCVTIINLCSLMGMVFLPMMKHSFYHKMLMFMVALAVGTLSGNALLVLIPEAFDMMSEESPFYHDYVWKCTTIIGGIYMFFLVERLLKNILEWRKKLHKFDSDESSMDQVSLSNNYEPLKLCNEDGSQVHNHPMSSVKTRDVHRTESLNMSFKMPASPKSKADGQNSAQKLMSRESESSLPEAKSSVVQFDLGACKEHVAESSNGSYSSEPNNVPQPPPSCPEQSQGLVNQGMTRSKESTGSFGFLKPNMSALQLLDPNAVMDQDSNLPTPSGSDTSKEEIKSIAWMVIFGDGIHNFIDGLSIGAAFAKNTMAGISVSVAVVCEELPHELGDFAILLNAGMSMRQALGYNFLSACSCYAGLVLGILIGEMTSGSCWIFALAAGMFLYISLVDMLPEVNHAAEEHTKATGHTWRVFFLQNVGLLTGYGIILILALYSDQIAFSTGL